MARLNSDANREAVDPMPRRLSIPRQVVDSIAAHISAAIDIAQDGFWSANEDEDALTGHLGACLKKGPQSVEVTQDEVNGTWKWSIDYAKFRGRGQDATESFLGADGIFELRLDWGARRESKALLFQSKVAWTSSPDLVKQALLLSTWREAAIAINYTSSSFDAYSIDSVLASRGRERNARHRLTLKEALINHFLECRVGNTDLSYDARARRLAWRDRNGVRVATQFSVPHRVRLEVAAPTYKQQFTYDKLIPTRQIHLHRMEAEAEQILRPLFSDQEETVTVMRKALAATYHPDHYCGLDKFYRDLATKRMQETNSAADEVREPRRR